MALYIVAQFHAKPGCERTLGEVLLANVEPTRAEPGCVYLHLYHAMKDTSTFFIHSAWTDEAEFDKHAALPRMTAFLSRVDELIDHELRAVRCSRLA